MIRNMGALDRALRAFVVAPLAIVLALIVGAGTVAGVILFIVAGIMLATSATGSARTTSGSASSTDAHVHRVGHHIRPGHA